MACGLLLSGEMRAIALALLITVPAWTAQAAPSPKPSALETAKSGWAEVSAGWSEFSAGEKAVAIGFGLVVGGMAGTGAIVVGMPTVAAGAVYAMGAGALTALAGLGALFVEDVRSSRARDARESAERDGFNGARTSGTLRPPASLVAPTGAAGAGMPR